jgi:Flp pilus assembly protein TadG
MTSFPNTHTSRNVAERFPRACEPLSKRCRRSAGLSRVRRPSRRGAAVTEFAVVAPVFFLMVVGFLEFGRALMVQQVLINASRVGARQAITTSATASNVEDIVEDYTSGVAVNGVVVAVSPDPAAADPGDTITVTTSVAFSNVSWMASPWFLGDTTLTASSQMRKEGFE